jgi:uncharacterized damage-inducible protein DinB
MTLVAVSLLASAAVAQDPKATDLRSILLEQLRTTHNQSDWFVCANVAVEGVTAEQANWTDGKGNHSIGQLTYHLLFWDRRALARFRGEDPGKFSGNNDDTFNNFDSKQWADTVRQLDEVLTDWEKAVQTADEERLKKNASLVAHVGAHNAYHIGQIVFVRKEQGSWDPSKGVK